MLDNAKSDDDDDDACTTSNATCEHSLDIDVLLAGMPEYPTGMYTFQIIAPDQSQYAIECFLPRADVQMECTGPNTQELVAWIDLKDPALIHFHVNGAPPNYTVLIYYNDVLLLEKFMEPEYDHVTPNGEDCKPLCYEGEVAVAVVIY